MRDYFWPVFSGCRNQECWGGRMDSNCPSDLLGMQRISKDAVDDYCSNYHWAPGNSQREPGSGQRSPETTLNYLKMTNNHPEQEMTREHLDLNIEDHWLKKRNTGAVLRIFLHPPFRHSINSPPLHDSFVSALYTEKNLHESTHRVHWCQLIIALKFALDLDICL